MARRLVFLYDGSMQPWSVNLEITLRQLTELQAKGVACEMLDTKDMPDEQLEHWRDEARTAAIWRHQRVRQPFGSQHKGGLPYFGKQVPALLVYEEGERIPVAVYPHSEKRGQEYTEFSIEGFLEEFVNMPEGEETHD